jgi:hypothetical protein
MRFYHWTFLGFLTASVVSLLALPSARSAYVPQSPCTPYHLAGGTAASNNSTLIKNSSGVLCDLVIINTTATLYYLKLYNSASAPTCSSATNLKHVFPIPAATTGAGFARHVPYGELYQTGIGFCVVGGGGDTDNTNAATGVFVEASYQ